MLPPMAPLERPEANLLVDPYVLGVWLGDGSKNNGVITCCDADATVIRKEIEHRGYITTDQNTKYTFGVLGLKVKLRDIGVLSNKHIPDVYMDASEAQRRDLLKGLMDTDGCVSKKGQCYWMQSDKALIDQVRVLLASLGIKNSVCESEAKIGDKTYGPTWRISFYANDIAVLPRKEERTLKGNRTFGRYIKVEKLGVIGNTQCIKVNRKDGLFIAGEGHIITHNTKSEFTSYLLPAWLLGKFPNKKIMQVSNTSELAEGFGRKVRNLVGSERYREIFPDVELRQDSKAAGRWNTNKNGEYFATGVGGALAGRGADMCLAEFTKIIIDDGGVEKEIDLVDVKIGDRIKTRDGYGIVTRKMPSRHEKSILINSTIRASGLHKFLTLDGWKAVEEITLDDRLCNSTGHYTQITSLEVIEESIPMLDITVEPQHEFLVRCIDDLIITHNCIVDDPHTEAEALAARTNPAIYDKTYDWYTSGPRQRLQPGGSILICMTRWHASDLTGQILEAAQKSDKMDQWRLVQFPAILPSGKPLWPEFWSLEELEAVKAEIPNSKWQAQYQQEPTSEEGALIKREWWREWTRDNPPNNIEFTLMSWDTAFEKHNNADYSAMTVWGVFDYEDENGNMQPNIILLDAVKKRVEFPELKEWVLEAYKEWEPDGVIIEKRASGASLIQELRRMGIPVQEFTPTKGNDKISRVNSVADIFASGYVWAPQTRWAEEVIDDVASFPAGKHDDIVDTVSMALIRFRQGGFVGTKRDEPEEEQYFRRKVTYY
jgi:predicted phage terminase large subunit-like protein